MHQLMTVLLRCANSLAGVSADDFWSLRSDGCCKIASCCWQVPLNDDSKAGMILNGSSGKVLVYLLVKCLAAGGNQ